MKILLVEHDAAAAKSLKSLLTRKSFRVEAISDGDMAMNHALNKGYDILLLDAEMPEFNIMRVIKHLHRNFKCTLVIVMTGSSDPEERINGLNAGADCYLQKPVTNREVLACINAMLRRQGVRTERVSFGNTTLDVAAGILCCGDNSIHLTDKEFSVARLLLQSGEHIIPKETILTRVWGLDKNNMENHVEVYVGFLRKKLETIGSNVQIKSDRRMGYHLEAVEK